MVVTIGRVFPLPYRTTCFCLPKGGAIEALIFKPPTNFNSSTNEL